MRALLLAAVLAIPSTAQAQPYWELRGCEHGHRSAVAYKQIRELVRHTNPTVRKQRVQHWATCLATKRKARAAHRKARAHWAWRHEYAQLWKIRLARLPASWVQWAKNITTCESRWDRYARDYLTGSHVSYFQWALSTWAAAGGTGHPFDASWEEQAVRAIKWAWKAGTSQWVCKG